MKRIIALMFCGLSFRLGVGPDEPSINVTEKDKLKTTAAIKETTQEKLGQAWSVVKSGLKYFGIGACLGFGLAAADKTITMVSNRRSQANNPEGNNQYTDSNANAGQTGAAGGNVRSITTSRQRAQ